jgi:hypothetical protein
LAEIGLEPERLEMYFLSSAEGIRFAEIATEMTERARALGPSPLKNGLNPDNISFVEESEHVITDQTIS